MNFNTILEELNNLYESAQVLTFTEVKKHRGNGKFVLAFGEYSQEYYLDMPLLSSGDGKRWGAVCDHTKLWDCVKSGEVKLITSWAEAVESAWYALLSNHSKEIHIMDVDSQDFDPVACIYWFKANPVIRFYNGSWGPETVFAQPEDGEITEALAETDEEEVIIEGVSPTTPGLEEAIKKVIGLYSEQLSLIAQGPNTVINTFMRDDLPNKEKAHKEMIDALNKNNYKVVDEFYLYNDLVKQHMSFITISAAPSVKESLIEAAEDEESSEEIPEETIGTVEDFVKNFDEYDGKLALEFKPIVIDGKEYHIKQLLWDDALEEGKLVAEIIFDMPEETEEVVEESTDQEVLNETLRLESKDKQLNDLATAIHKAFVAKNLGDSIEVSTSAVKCEFGSGGHIVIKTADKISDKTAEVIKQYALKYLQAEDAKADIAEIKRIDGLTYVILDNISIAKKQAEMVKVEELE